MGRNHGGYTGGFQSVGGPLLYLIQCSQLPCMRNRTDPQIEYRE